VYGLCQQDGIVGFVEMLCRFHGRLSRRHRERAWLPKSQRRQEDVLASPPRPRFVTVPKKRSCTLPIHPKVQQFPLYDIHKTRSAIKHTRQDRQVLADAILKKKVQEQMRE